MYKKHVLFHNYLYFFILLHALSSNCIEIHTDVLYIGSNTFNSLELFFYTCWTWEATYIQSLKCAWNSLKCSGMLFHSFYSVGDESPMYSCCIQSCTYTLKHFLFLGVGIEKSKLLYMSSINQKLCEVTVNIFQFDRY